MSKSIIVTHYWQKPVPSIKFDWEATYDYDIGSPIGYGATEQEAIDNLLEQLRDRGIEL